MDIGRSVMERVQPAHQRETMVMAALTLLDRNGLSHCSVEAVAERLGMDVVIAYRSFSDRGDLLAAMGERMMEEGAGRGLAGNWRERLAQRAQAGRRAMLSRHDGAMLFAQLAEPFSGADGVLDCTTALGEAGFATEDARAAQRLVDRFTIGWTLSEQAMPDMAGSQDEFARQLDVVISGIASAHGDASEAIGDEGLRGFQSRLWLFLRNARESANIAFARTVHINELDRRILLLLQAQGDMTLAAISVANGVDKAQVSRAIKRLGEVGLLLRGGIRSPIHLSTSGRHLADKLQKQAELRNRELTYGISDEQIAALSEVLDILLARAIALFEQERKAVMSNQGPEPVDFQDLVSEGLPGENGVVVDRTRVLPPFITLCSYMLRGGALAHKRSTGLSNFETWVLSEVSRNPPISWPQLVVALYRDQSQAGRTVNHLVDIGLVERSGKPGRRHGFFAPTPEGERIYAIIAETGSKRCEFLFQGIPAPLLATFMTAFESLEHNSSVQLARERAIQEMDRGE